MTATVISLYRGPDHLPVPTSAETEARALRGELRRARTRIAQLEASLAEVLRDNVVHFERARKAEQDLTDLLAEREVSETA
jgi:hypothetical protein